MSMDSLHTSIQFLVSVLCNIIFINGKLVVLLFIVNWKFELTWFEINSKSLHQVKSKGVQKNLTVIKNAVRLAVSTRYSKYLHG